jgi:predicted metal-dependent phosphoesterase TrpH
MNKISFSKAVPKKGFMCIDMHCHTNHSDGVSSPEEILNKLRKENIGVAITDHTRISGCIEIFKIKKESDLIIPGIEAMSKEGFDVLFYFYNLKTLIRFYEKEIKSNKITKVHYDQTTLSFKDLVMLRKKYNCVVSLAHPFGYTIRAKPLDIEKDIFIIDCADAIEVINGGNNHKLNIRAVDLCKKYNKGYTGGSDSHSIFGIGDVLTCSKADSIKMFLDNIKKKENHVIGKEPFFGRPGFFFYYFLNRMMKKWNLIKT